MFVMCCWKIASLNIIGLWKKQRAVSGSRSSVLCTGSSQTLLHCPCKCRKLLWAVLLNVDFLHCTLGKTPDQMATYNFIYLLVTIFVCMGCDLLILYKTCKELQVSNALWLLGTESCVFSVCILLVYHSLHTWMFSLIYSQVSSWVETPWWQTSFLPAVLWQP